METRCGGLLFTSKFDSGNLARVEKVGKDDDDGDGPVTNTYYNGSEPKPDYEFNVWTKPDMGGTQYENGNRSWFYFGVKGGSPGRLIKINVVNMNRQGKLYSQGHSPIVKTVPGKPRWDRIRDRPTYETVDGQFILSFTHRFLETKGSTTYFAFCYPWTYAESQNQMALLDTKFSRCVDFNSQTSPDQIYYHRELLCHSLDRLRIDLLTITDCHGIQDQCEPRFDSKLFIDTKVPRCKQFKNKRVYLISSRVHPGETPASHVYNGMLEFLLREDDPRARQLRRQYVFKLIPMLNPDGVVRGHYRTDSRGVNLNRMYLDPDFDIYPSIYASKALLVYHHVANQVTGRRVSNASLRSSMQSISSNSSSKAPESSRSNDGEQQRLSGFSASHRKAMQREEERIQQQQQADDMNLEEPLSCLSLNESESYEMEGMISGHEAASGGECQDSDEDVERPHIGNEGSDEDDTECCQPRAGGGPFAPHLSDPKLREIPHDKSGIAMFVDLHAHASKRGCFIYGNYYEDEDTQVDNMLFSKLISLNTAHFDFTACNFTERNMYLKDKREGLSKEGAGRVALYKALGIIHSYTLECNYNTGRMVNSVPAAYGDAGRATPPPLAGFPPKYRPEHFEDVGRALLIAMLDITETNPWSRLTLSEHCGLHGVKDYVRRFIRGLRGLPKGAVNRPQKAAIKAAAAASAAGNSQNGQVRASAAASSSPLKSSSMTSTKQTPIPRVATLSRSTTSSLNHRQQQQQQQQVMINGHYRIGSSTSSNPRTGGHHGGAGASRIGSGSGGGGRIGSGTSGVNRAVPAPPAGGGRGRGASSRASMPTRELPSVREGGVVAGSRGGSVPGLRRNTIATGAGTNSKSLQHSMSAPVPLTLTNSTSTDIKGLSSDSAGMFRAGSPAMGLPPQPPYPSEPASPGRQTSAESNYSIEEEKVQQLKHLSGFSRTSVYSRTAKPLEPPKSDPVKRRNKRNGGATGSKIRRSSSHSPKSAKLAVAAAAAAGNSGTRKLGTITSSVDMDFERKVTTKSKRRKSMASRNSKAAKQQLQQQTSIEDTIPPPILEVDAGPDLSGSAVKITPRYDTDSLYRSLHMRVANQQPASSAATATVGGNFLLLAPTISEPCPLNTSSSSTATPAVTASTRPPQPTSSTSTTRNNPPGPLNPQPPPQQPPTTHRTTGGRSKRKTSHKRGSRAAVEVKPDIEKLTARLAEQRLQRLMQQQRLMQSQDQHQQHAQFTEQAFWIDF